MTVSEEQLIEQIKLGNPDAFEQLVSRHETRIYTIAYRYMGNHSDACDVAQEALLRIYRSIHGFRGDSSFTTWLFRVVTNVCKDELRRRAKDKAVSMDEMAADGREPVLASRENLPEEKYLCREWQEEIQQILNTLSLEHRTVLVMRDIQGYSYEEIAFFLSCSLGTVKSRLNRARKVFKECLTARKELLHGRACRSG